MVDLKSVNSTKLATKLLDNNIFIKDLRTKTAFKNKNFIRLAILQLQFVNQSNDILDWH